MTENYWIYSLKNDFNISKENIPVLASILSQQGVHNLISLKLKIKNPIWVEQNKIKEQDEIDILNFFNLLIGNETKNQSSSVKDQEPNQSSQLVPLKASKNKRASSQMSVELHHLHASNLAPKNVSLKTKKAKIPSVATSHDSICIKDKPNSNNKKKDFINLTPEDTFAEFGKEEDPKKFALWSLFWNCLNNNFGFKSLKTNLQCEVHVKKNAPFIQGKIKSNKLQIDEELIENFHYFKAENKYWLMIQVYLYGAIDPYPESQQPLDFKEMLIPYNGDVKMYLKSESIKGYPNGYWNKNLNEKSFNNNNSNMMNLYDCNNVIMTTHGIEQNSSSSSSSSCPNLAMSADFDSSFVSSSSKHSLSSIELSPKADLSNPSQPLAKISSQDEPTHFPSEMTHFPTATTTTTTTIKRAYTSEGIKNIVARLTGNKQLEATVKSELL